MSTLRSINPSMHASLYLYQFKSPPKFEATEPPKLDPKCDPT